MLSRDLELADLDARHWRHWWELLVPPRVLAQPRFALAIVAGQPPRAERVIVSGQGAIVPTPPLPAVLDEAHLLRWGKKLGADAVVVLDRGVIGALSAEIEAGLGLEQDYVEQGLVALRALKRRAGRGIWTAPALLDLVPAPPFDGLQRTFDLLVPDKASLIAYVIEDDRRAIHASIIAHKRGGDIARAATHRAIADVVPEVAFARAWDKQTDRVVQAVAARYGKPSIALFLERGTVLRIMTGPADQLARELDAGKVIIDPAPAWLLGLLGGATVAAMAGRGARALASMLPQAARDRASDLAARAQSAMRGAGAHPFALLGFDPIELWTRLRKFYR